MINLRNVLVVLLLLVLLAHFWHGGIPLAFSGSLGFLLLLLLVLVLVGAL
jgi:hypothetical protein